MLLLIDVNMFYFRSFLDVLLIGIETREFLDVIEL